MSNRDADINCHLSYLRNLVKMRALLIQWYHRRRKNRSLAATRVGLDDERNSGGVFGYSLSDAPPVFRTLISSP